MLPHSLNSLLANSFRWEGTPFIIKSGKALNDHKSGAPRLSHSRPYFGVADRILG
jgi:hypothetical protein